MVFIRSALILFLVAVTSPVLAQGTPGWQDNLKAYMSDPESEQRIIEIVKVYERDRAGACTSLEFVRMLPLPLAPVQFDLSGRPQNGSWLTKVFTRRCGTEVIHNVLFEAKNGEVVAKGMLPGETRSSRYTQPTISQKLAEYVQTKRPPVPGCTELVIMTTRLKTAPVRSGPAEEWQEEWTTKRCARTDNVVIDFRAVRGRLENFRFPS